MDAATMAEGDGTTVEISYRTAAIAPPLFVAGSFSSPPWTPLEMAHTQTATGEHVFSRAIRVKPGTAAVQYKFRVGAGGDWWLLDESRPTVTDDQGNQNNLLRVADFTSAEKPPTPPPDALFLAPDVLSGRPWRVHGMEEALDGPDDELPQADIGPALSHELPGEDDHGHNDEAPMFAYEFAGGYERPASISGSEYSPGLYPRPQGDDGPVTDGDGADQKDSKAQAFDPEDPTLERFPSSREEILERVRHLETGLDEDRTAFDGFPASPVVDPGRKRSFDLAGGEALSVSPTAGAGGAGGGGRLSGRRLEAHQRSISRDSFALDSPALHCIVEEGHAEDGPGPSSPHASPKTAAAALEPVPSGPAVVVTSAEGPVLLASAADEDQTVSPTGPDASDEPPSSTGTSAAAETHPVANTGAVRGNNSWLAAYVHFIFVEWLGGLLGRLYRWWR